VRPWTEQFPDRLQFELAEFGRQGLSFAPDAGELERHGRLIMRGAFDSEGDDVDLEVVYPDTFPYLRPEVFAHGLGLERHQNPYDGNLCLLDRSTRAWKPSDTGAWLVAARVPYLLRLMRDGGEALREAEVPQGEPGTSFLLCEPGTAVFVPAEALELAPEVVGGKIALRVSPGEPLQPRLRAGLVRVTTKDNGSKRSLAVIDESLTQRFSGARVDGPWVRLASLPAARDPQGLLEAAAAVNPDIRTPRWHRTTGGELAVTGLVVAEEVGHGDFQTAWFFVVRLRRKTGRGWEESAYVVRGDRLTVSDMAARIPGLAGLPSKSVAQVGLGALGAPVAMELARGQLGELHLLDFDMVESSTTVRWPFGLSAVGFIKVDFVAGVLAQDYPFTRVKGYRHQIGYANRQTGNEAALLTSFLDGADLIIDTAAEIGISQLLASLAQEAELPLLTMWGTEGGWGGAVASVVPGAGGCWHCLQLGIDDGTIPAAPFEVGGAIQPRGCAALTFTGTSSDLLEVVAHGLRVARRLLLDPDPGCMVHVCSMRDAEGQELPAPQWNSQALDIHPRCPVCHVAAAA
jgi:hypothetical protein